MNSFNPNAQQGRIEILILAFLLNLLSSNVIFSQTYTFTPCGASGRFGPTQTQANSTYSNTSLNGQVTVTSGIQYWVVPASGVYKIEAYGAKGGNGSSTTGGNGAKMQGEFSFTNGQILKILVGQVGGNGNSAGGGGGSFVTDNSNNPFIVAGGSGGAAYLNMYSSNSGNMGGVTTTSAMGGTNGNASITASSGGTSGNGGPICTTFTIGEGSGGGGFSTNGADGNPSTGGLAFISGGNGGAGVGSSSGPAGDGGFGGGGGSDWSNNTGSGGGGGYSGGGGGTYFGLGGGGASYNGGTNQVNTASVNAGSGYIVFTKISGVNIVQTSSVTCNGQTNAVLTASAFGGLAPYTYSWSSGGITSATITGLGAGTYTCIATDSSSPAVVYTNTFVIAQPALLAASISQTNVTCFGGANGKLKATPSGGNSPYTYTWMPGGAATSSVSNLTAGAYTVIIRDANACTSTFTVNVIQPSALSIFAFASSPTVCSGESSVLVAAGTGGTPAYTYTWSGGVTNGVPFTQTATATYTVNGTDANGCASSTTASILVNPNPTLSIAGSGTICSGSSLTLTTSGANSYTWSTGSNSASIIVNPTSTTVYTVTGSNSNGCTGVKTETIIVGTSPVISINSSTPSVCQGNSVTLTASGASTYTWSNGIANGNAFVPSSTASYTVTGGNTCGTGSAVVSVTVNPLPNITASASSTVVCLGSTVTLSGSGGVSYSWSNGVINNSPFTPTSTLTYFMTGTDANGCQSTVSKIVNVNPLPNVTANASSTFVCSGSSMIVYGSGANTYTWSGGVYDNVVFSPTISATYTVTGTDANGCQNTAVRTISVGNIPVVSANATGSSVCIGGTTTLYGGGATTYTWSNGISNNVSFSPTVTATYTVSGSNSCGTASNTIIITVNSLPLVTAGTINSVVCSGFTTSLFGGGAQTYTWTNGVSNNVAFTPSVTSAYTVTGTDANGCKNTAVKTITVNSRPTVTTSINSMATCAGNTVVLFASGADTFTWTGGVTNGQSFIPSATGSYSVSGTNTLTGCTSTNVVAVSITVNPLPNIAVNSTNSVICNGNPVSLNGTGAHTYTWTNGIINGVSFSPSVTNTYSVTGTNTLTGCTNTAITSVTVNALPIVTVGTTAFSVCAGGSVTFYGAGASTYTWTGGVQNGITFNPTVTATYSLSGTNALTGCTSTNSAYLTLTVQPLPVVSINASTTQVCSGDLITLTATGANTYIWTPGITNGIPFTITANGSYSVTGTNTLTGCTSTNQAAKSISVLALPFVSITGSNPLMLCVGENANLTASGAVSYTWNPGGQGAMITISPSITTVYTVTGMDANGCTNKATYVQNVDDCTGLRALFLNTELLIFPNPSSGQFVISAKEATDLTLINELGQSIKTLSLNEKNNYKANISDVPNGIYFIVSLTGNQVLKQKIIVAK
jgi:hypothetical protein